MKVIFDALGSTERSGGMRLHSTEVVKSWLENFPDDHVTVIGGAWAKDEFEPRGAEVIVLQNESVVGRATGQLFVAPWVRLRKRADAVVSLSPIVSPLVPRSRAFCFQHDWRHKKNPHEFPRVQRWYRYLWQLSAKHAATNVCISEKAEAETVDYVPGARTAVIENGYDHARSWPASPESAVSGRYIVTFGHHNNKRPELLIEALGLVEDESTGLVILGASGEYRESLVSLARAHGVVDRVHLPGFVDDAQYQSFVSHAGVVALVSSDEGFGLPIAEALYLGIPAVVTSDSGMDTIFGDYPWIADPNAESISAALSAALASPVRPAPSSTHSWDDTARALRDLLPSGDRVGAADRSSVEVA